MQNLSLRTIQTKAHPEAKMVFWYVFASSRGGPNRIKIMSLLKNRPFNAHQLSREIGLEYKGIQHHIRALEKNNLITKIGEGYGICYFPSPLFESNQEIFDEIVTKLKKVGGPEWST